MEKSRCCGAPLIGGVQCATCGADDRKYGAVCPKCKKFTTDREDIDAIDNDGECMQCEKLWVESLTNQS